MFTLKEVALLMFLLLFVPQGFEFCIKDFFCTLRLFSSMLLFSRSPSREALGDYNRPQNSRAMRVRAPKHAQRAIWTANPWMYAISGAPSGQESVTFPRSMLLFQKSRLRHFQTNPCCKKRNLGITLDSIFQSYRAQDQQYVIRRTQLFRHMIMS